MSENIYHKIQSNKVCLKGQFCMLISLVFNLYFSSFHESEQTDKGGVYSMKTREKNHQSCKQLWVSKWHYTTTTKYKPSLRLINKAEKWKLLQLWNWWNILSRRATWACYLRYKSPRSNELGFALPPSTTLRRP